MPTISFAPHPPTVAQPGMTLSERSLDDPLAVTSHALRTLQDDLLPEFAAQVQAALATEQVGLDALPGCLTAVEALQHNLNAVKPPDAPADATYGLDTQQNKEKTASHLKTVATSLSDTACSLDEVRAELKAQMVGGPAPGWMIQMLHRVGTLLGAIAAAGVLVSATLLALPVAAVITLGAAGATLAYIAGKAAQVAAEARLKNYQLHSEQDAQRRACLAQLDALRAMVIRAQVDLGIANVRDHLTPDAATHHRQLLSPTVVDASGKPVTGAPQDFRPKQKFIGDGDGSDFRVILAAFEAGYIVLTDKGQALLAQGLQAEADYVRQKHGTYSTYQQNEALCALADDLWVEMTFREGIDPLIFIGDLAHDRLASNMDFGRRVREALKWVGVNFMQGNHDDYRVRVDGCGQLSPDDQFAGFAKDSAKDDSKLWQAHERAVFDDIYYDEKTGVIANHQGFRLGPDGTVQTAQGFFRFTGNPADLVKDIRNNRRVPMPTNAKALRPSQKLQLLMSLALDDAGRLPIGGSANSFLQFMPAGACTAERWTDAQQAEIAAWLETYNKPNKIPPEFWEARLAMYHRGDDQLSFHTDFRPSFEDNKSVVKAFAAEGHPMILIKGHNGTFATGDGVLSINPREGERGALCPAAVALYLRETAGRVGAAEENPWLALSRIAPAKLSKPAPMVKDTGAGPALGSPNALSV